MLIQASNNNGSETEKGVAKKASFCLVNVLQPRNPQLFYKYFTGKNIIFKNISEKYFFRNHDPRHRSFKDRCK